MSPERDERLRDLFVRARRMAPGEREPYVLRQAAGDDALARDVLSLLRYDTPTDDFEGHPARAAAAELVRDGAALGADLLAAVPDSSLSIGRFRVLRSLGAGGFGLVYLAEQESPRRLAAVKVMHPRATPTDLRRFRGESEALARLRHPGIAQVYEAGVWHEGGERPYIAMEYVEGLALDDYAAAHALSNRERAEVLARVCDAVEHAHRRGVIHRDLAPKNIVVDREGAPRILDFGVARLLGRDGASRTLSGDATSLVGTLGYMSPEQLAGDPLAIDTRADVYALGVIAYELFARRRMLDVRDLSLAAALEMARSAVPARPSSIDRTLRGDLEAIILKAVERDPDRRFQSASDLASDLRRWLRDEPVEARTPGALYVTRKFVVRHRSWAAAALALVLIVAVAVTHALAVRRAERESHAAALNALDAIVTRVLSPLAPKLGSVDERAQLLEIIGADVENIAARSPESVQAQRLRGRYLAALGDIEEARGEVVGAIAMRRESLKAYRRIVDAAYGDIETMHECSIAMVRLGDLLKGIGRTDDSHRLYEEALELDEAQVRRHPGDVRLLSNLFWSYCRAGDLHTESDSEEAIRLAERGRDVAADMRRIAPGAWRTLESGVASEVRVSELRRRGGDMIAAEEHARAAIDFARRLIVLDPLSIHVQNLLTRSHWAAVMALGAQGRAEESDELIAQCVATFREAVGAGIDSIESIESLTFERSIITLRLDALRARQQPSDVGTLTEGVEVGAALMRRAPGDHEVCEWHGSLLLQRMRVHSEQGRRDEAERDARRLLEAADRAERAFPTRSGTLHAATGWRDAVAAMRAESATDDELIEAASR